jgi:hypothetical protein
LGLTLLIEGEPRDSFPVPLADPAAFFAGEPSRVAELAGLEPLAADIRGRNGPDLGKLPLEALRLLAPMLRCRFDDLRQRHLHRRRRQRLATAATAAGVAASLALGWWEMGRIQAGRDRAELAADVHGLAANLQARWQLFEAMPVLDDFDRQHMEDTRRTRPAQADIASAYLANILTARAEQVRGVLHDYPVGAAVEPAVLAAAARLAVPDAAVRFVHGEADMADFAAVAFSRALNEAQTYLRGNPDMEAIYPRKVENERQRTGLYTELAIEMARRQLLDICRAGCPPAETAWLAATRPGRGPAEVMPLLERLQAEKSELMDQTLAAAKALSASMVDVAAIKPGDDSRLILIKSMVLRKFGRTAESLAGFALWHERFGAAEADKLPLVEASEQLTRQYDELHVESGAYVHDIDAGSEAARIGLREGDLIVSYDGAAFDKMEVLTAALGASAGRSSVPLEILRRGQDGRFQRLSLTPAGGKLGITLATI